ncbi:MAG: hypothetical protein KGH98_03305, partial [Candidatus Micrarchaeota archaeon]|nr:hypothetical protein [Candidatus Micrarchaeota archaeon]
SGVRIPLDPPNLCDGLQKQGILIGKFVLAIILAYLSVNYLILGAMYAAAGNAASVIYIPIGIILLIALLLANERWKLSSPAQQKNLKTALGISSDTGMQLRLFLVFLGAGFLVLGLLMFGSPQGTVLITLGIVVLVMRFAFVRK